MPDTSCPTVELSHLGCVGLDTYVHVCTEVLTTYNAATEDEPQHVNKLLSQAIRKRSLSPSAYNLNMIPYKLHNKIYIDYITFLHQMQNLFLFTNVFVCLCMPSSSKLWFLFLKLVKNQQDFCKAKLLPDQMRKGSCGFK